MQTGARSITQETKAYAPEQIAQLLMHQSSERLESDAYCFSSLAPPPPPPPPPSLP